MNSYHHSAPLWMISQLFTISVNCPIMFYSHSQESFSESLFFTFILILSFVQFLWSALFGVHSQLRLHLLAYLPHDLQRYQFIFHGLATSWQKRRLFYGEFKSDLWIGSYFIGCSANRLKSLYSSDWFIQLNNWNLGESNRFLVLLI